MLLLLPCCHDQELEAKLNAKLQQDKKGSGGTAGSSSSGGLFNFQAMAHTILGNLQLRLSNIHIR